MYQGGMVAKQEAEKRAEAQMMGETQIELPKEELPSKVHTTCMTQSYCFQSFARDFPHIGKMKLASTKI